LTGNTLTLQTIVIHWKKQVRQIVGTYRTLSHNLISKELNRMTIEDNTTSKATVQNQIINQFNYHGNEIKAITDENGEPWFIAKDVCSILNIVWKGSETLGALDDDEKDVVSADTLGGVQEMISINESGLYTLIMRSNKPEAKPFRKKEDRDVNAAKNIKDNAVAA